MSFGYSPLVIDSHFFSDTKRIVRERIIPWEGLARAGVISEDDANLVKILEKQSVDNRNKTVVSQLPLYANTLLNLLNKLEVNSKDDVVKNILTLISDLFVDLPGNELLNSMLELSALDDSLPFFPFLKHLDNADVSIKTLSLYNLVVLLSLTSKRGGNKVDEEVVIKVLDLLCSSMFLGNFQDVNLQFVGVQLLQELLISKYYKEIFQKHNLVTNFKYISQLISNSSSQPNSNNLQLTYYTLLTTWVISFNPFINKTLVHHYPELIGNLLKIAQDSIKLKIVRVSIGVLRNFIAVATSDTEQFKTIKILLFHEGLSAINTLKERKFASNGSDEELSNDLVYLSDNLNQIVNERLTSFEEYLTELENPNLISWSSPTHKSADFWMENSSRFKEKSFSLVKRIFEILATSSDNATTKVILLNDLQFLIRNLGNDLISFINTEKSGQYKIMIMELLDNNNGNHELKYQALRAIQLLVGHNF